MVNPSGLPFRINGADPGRIGGNGEGPHIPSDPLSASIVDLLHQRWVEDDPSETCFDHDEVRLNSLLCFIDGSASSEESDFVREHLIECPRCRFLYGRLRSQSRCSDYKIPEDADNSASEETQPVPELLRKNLRTTGPVVFPGDELSEGAWEFGRLGELDWDVAERICNTIAGRAWQKLRSVLSHERIVLVCFSDPMHRCGKRLATKMVEGGFGDVHVVMADDFFAPKLWCDPSELHSGQVVVLVDVVHSGGLLSRLYSVCREAGPAGIIGVAVIDQSRGTAQRGSLCSLWHDAREERVPSASSTKSEPRFFDPAAARAHRRLPKEVADPAMARATVEQHLKEINPIVPYIAATGALRRDAQIGGVCYPWAVDLLRLLKNDDARGEFAARALASLRDLSKLGQWCLVYPASRFKRAGAWAELIAQVFGWPIVKVGFESCNHYRPLTADQRRALAKCRRAVIVDAAIRTGKTLQSLISLLRGGPVPAVSDVKAFYAFDGLFQEAREKLEREVKVEVRSLFRVPLGAPTEPLGRHCRRRLSETLAEITESNDDEALRWARAVREYCLKKLEPTARPIKMAPSRDVRIDLRLAIDEGLRGTQARLEQACDPPRPSLVKHLDVPFALREPRTRNVLHGFLCNSMPPEFIEWCALALATQRDYDWLDRDWLVLHKRFFTNSASERWQFLTCIGYWIRQEGNVKQMERIRGAVEEFRRTEVSDGETLFPDALDAPGSPNSFESRCDTLAEVLTPA